MNKIHNNILEAIGDTPIFSIQTINTNYVFGKLERVNPTGSVYDRVANTLMQSIQSSCNLDTSILTSVNDEFGLAVAMVCATFKLNCVVVSTRQLSKDIQQGIIQYGAKLELVDGGVEQVRLRQQELFDSNPINTIRLDEIDDSIFNTISYNFAREIYSQIVGVVSIVIIPKFVGLQTQPILEYFATKKTKIEVLFGDIASQDMDTNQYTVYTTLEDQYNGMVDLCRMGIRAGFKSGVVWAAVKQYSKQAKNKGILAVLVD
jgi:cysteine synthase